MYKRVTFVISGFLLVGAFMIVAAKRMDTSGLILTVPLQQLSDSTTHRFTVPTTAQYRIGVECSRNLPSETLEALLKQGNLVEVELHHGAAPAKLNYFGQPVSQSADSTAQFGNLNFGNDTIGQDIAYFSGSPREQYEVSYTVIRPLDALNGTNPTFIVYRDPTPDVVRGFASLALLVTGYALLTLGAGLGIYHFLLRRA